jgi:hypothetical protein
MARPLEAIIVYNFYILVSNPRYRYLLVSLIVTNGVLDGAPKRAPGFGWGLLTLVLLSIDHPVYPVDTHVYLPGRR